MPQFKFLRIAVAMILLAQVYWVAPSFFDLYGRDGILEGVIRTKFGSGIALDGTLLVAVAFLYVAGLVGMLVGFHERLSSFAAWGSHVLLGSGHVSSYGLDSFASIALFYLILPRTPLVLKIIQAHLSIAYFTCGLDKAMGIQWWNGEAVWRSLMMPLYAQMDSTWMARHPWLPLLAGWGTLVVECGYPIGMWVPKLRPYWLRAIVGLHLGIFLFMGLHLFALMMIVLSLSAFADFAALDRLRAWVIQTVISASPVSRATRSIA